MTKSVTTLLTEWFNGLTDEEKKEILRFLYGSAYRTMKLVEGEYCGPAPDLIKKGGLFTGPSPSMGSSDSSVCPTCGKPW
jgi:hypothetical protein